jgi:hypothetical protein
VQLTPPGSSCSIHIGCASPKSCAPLESMA